MRYTRFTVIAAASALLLSAYSFAPKIDVNNNPFMKITGVERTDSTLRKNVTLFHLPGYWVEIPSTSHLTASDDTTLQYRIKGAENIEIDQKIWMHTYPVSIMLKVRRGRILNVKPCSLPL